MTRYDVMKHWTQGFAAGIAGIESWTEAEKKNEHYQAGFTAGYKSRGVRSQLLDEYLVSTGRQPQAVIKLAAPAPKEATPKGEPEPFNRAWPEGDKLDEYLLEEAIMVKGRVCEFVIGSSSAMIVCDGQYLRPQGYWSNIEFHYPNEAFARRFAKTLSVAADLEQAAKDFWEEYEKTKT